MKKTLLLILTLSILFSFLEIGFRFFFVQSNGFGQTLAFQKWKEKYWRPINSDGYRDREHSANELSESRLVFVVGDSFAAGQGINHAGDRFSDLLQKKLGDNWRVINIAKLGWSTQDEFYGILQYPAKPDVIILSYFVNDILAAAKENSFPLPARRLSPFHNSLGPLISRSHFLNFLYWRIFRLSHARMFQDYWAYCQQCYQRLRIWNTHCQELFRIKQMAENRNADLIVVVFPNFGDMAGSLPITKKVAAFFKSEGIPVLDLGEYFFGRKTKELVVNKIDFHPNEAVHAEVAELLYKNFWF